MQRLIDSEREAQCDINHLMSGIWRLALMPGLIFLIIFKSYTLVTVLFLLKNEIVKIQAFQQ
jgi:hypothetical protein